LIFHETNVHFAHREQFIIRDQISRIDTAQFSIYYTSKERERDRDVTGIPVFTGSLSFYGRGREEKERRIRPRPQKEREPVKTGIPVASLLHTVITLYKL
jgi:hypothetical protein